MFVTRNVIKKTTLVGKNMLALQVRHNNGSSIWAYPRERVSFPEKVVHAIFITVGILATPTYVLCNLKHYSPPPTEDE